LTHAASKGGTATTANLRGIFSSHRYYAGRNGLCSVNGHRCERVVGEGGGIRRHEHDGAHTRITDIRKIADLPGGFPSHSTSEGAEPGIVGMLSAVRNAGSGTRLRAGDRPSAVSPPFE